MDKNWWQQCASETVCFSEELPQPIWARVPTPLLGNSKKAHFPNLGFLNFGSLCGECCGSCWCGNVFWAWLNRTTKVLYLSECPTIASYWSITFVFFLKDGFAQVPECLSVSLKSCKNIVICRCGSNAKKSIIYYIICLLGVVVKVLKTFPINLRFISLVFLPSVTFRKIAFHAPEKCHAPDTLFQFAQETGKK